MEISNVFVYLFYSCSGVFLLPKPAVYSKSRCFIQCFAGHQPKSRENVESPLEKYPKKVISLILRYKPGKVSVAVVFLAYIVSSIYGALN